MQGFVLVDGSESGSTRPVEEKKKPPFRRNERMSFQFRRRWQTSDEVRRVRILGHLIGIVIRFSDHRS